MYAVVRQAVFRAEPQGFLRAEVMAYQSVLRTYPDGSSFGVCAVVFRAVSFPRDYPSQALQFPSGNLISEESVLSADDELAGFYFYGKAHGTAAVQFRKIFIETQGLSFFRLTEIQVFQIHTNQNAAIGKGKTETDRFGRDSRKQRLVCPLNPIALYFV